MFSGSLVPITRWGAKTSNTHLNRSDDSSSVAGSGHDEIAFATPRGVREVQSLIVVFTVVAFFP